MPARYCRGHMPGPNDPMGQSVYCDGSCERGRQKPADALAEHPILAVGRAAAAIAQQLPHADRRSCVIIHAAACWLVGQGEGDALFLSLYGTGTSLWRTSSGLTSVRRKTGGLDRLLAARAAFDAEHERLDAAARAARRMTAKELDSAIAAEATDTRREAVVAALALAEMEFGGDGPTVRQLARDILARRGGR